MSQVSKKVPPAMSRGTRKWDELVKAALADRGEWYSAPTQKGAAHDNVEIRRVVGMIMAEVTINGDTAYLRIRPDSEVSA